ncbi:hypothetical protein PYCCODRAFT_1243594 [Trametes coccinea BRFM310]|uniref:Uncharacterized protein n=1 Tax=Trametes coccinea (strain BRFM310) TaxID=1353009 RepID=A0A1Y2IWN3_TRAC3|nr:hypothetical protein PYCCODRAFT_1243594 [Trametes coccinea BRFM310]
MVRNIHKGTTVWISRAAPGWHGLYSQGGRNASSWHRRRPSLYCPCPPSTKDNKHCVRHLLQSKSIAMLILGRWERIRTELPCMSSHGIVHAVVIGPISMRLKRISRPTIHVPVLRCVHREPRSRASRPVPPYEQHAQYIESAMKSTSLLTAIMLRAQWECPEV